MHSGKKKKKKKKKKGLTRMLTGLATENYRHNSCFVQGAGRHHKQREYQGTTVCIDRNVRICH